MEIRIYTVIVACALMAVLVMALRMRRMRRALEGANEKAEEMIKANQDLIRRLEWKKYFQEEQDKMNRDRFRLVVRNASR